MDHSEQPTQRTITNVLDEGIPEDLNGLIGSIQGRFAKLVFHIARGIQPKHRTRVINEEDVFQEVLIAIAKELRAQAELRALNQQLIDGNTAQVSTGNRNRLVRFVKKAKNRQALKEAGMKRGLALTPLLSDIPTDDPHISENRISQCFVEIEANRAHFALLVAQAVELGTFKNGDHVRKWLCAVTSNKALDALEVNLEMEGASACVRLSNDGERQDPGAALDEQAGLAEFISALPDAMAQITDLQHQLDQLSHAVNQQVAALHHPEKKIIKQWLDWHTLEMIATGCAVSKPNVRRTTFDFKSLPAIAAKTSFRDPIVMTIRDVVRNSPGLSNDPKQRSRQEQRRTQECWERFVRFFLVGTGTRVIADLKEKPQ